MDDSQMVQPTGRWQLERSLFNPRRFLGETLKIMAAGAHEKQLELVYRVAPDVPDRLVGDPDRFRHVLGKLVGNAVKYTDVGEIVVSAACSFLTDVRLMLHVAVRDTGVGIAADRQALIAQAFKQAAGRTNRNGGSTGLGLAVSAQLVSLMGGQIDVESDMGRGTTFHFTLACDVDIEQSRKGDLPDNFDLSGLRVLVVDHNTTTLKMVCKQLSGWKMRPTPVPTAVAAATLLDKIRQRTAGIDLALIDADLPHSGALFLVRQIKSDAVNALRTIVMLTATTKKTGRFDGMGLGSHVTKPVRPSDLFDAICRVVPIADRGHGFTAVTDRSALGDDADDMAALLKVFNNDGAFFNDMAEIFLSDYPPLLATLEKAIADKDGDVIDRIAHSLKGMASNFKVDAAADAARHVELLAGQGQFAGARDHFEKLAGELCRFERRLKQAIARVTQEESRTTTPKVNMQKHIGVEKSAS